MMLHRNAKLGLAGRFALVQAIEGGMSMKAAAAAFSVSPATAHRGWHRWREAGEQARSSLACLLDRSSRPHRSPRELAPELQERICACRRETGWGPPLVAAVTGFAHSTVWKVLKRAGISRPERAPREPANRHEWPCPVDLPHVHVRPHARSQRPRANGKVERFHQTMAREWAYGVVYRSHRQRNQALPHWLDHYTRRRPHSSLGDRPRSAAFTTSVGRTTSCGGVARSCVASAESSGARARWSSDR